MKTSCLQQIRRYKLGLKSRLGKQGKQGNARLRVSQKVMDSNPQGPGRVGDVNLEIFLICRQAAIAWTGVEVVWGLEATGSISLKLPLWYTIGIRVAEFQQKNVWRVRTGSTWQSKHNENSMKLSFCRFQSVSITMREFPWKLRHRQRLVTTSKINDRQHTTS